MRVRVPMPAVTIAMISASVLLLLGCKGPDVATFYADWKVSPQYICRGQPVTFTYTLSANAAQYVEALRIVPDVGEVDSKGPFPKSRNFDPQRTTEYQIQARISGSWQGYPCDMPNKPIPCWKVWVFGTNEMDVPLTGWGEDPVGPSDSHCVWKKEMPAGSVCSADLIVKSMKNVQQFDVIAQHYPNTTTIPAGAQPVPVNDWPLCGSWEFFPPKEGEPTYQAYQDAIAQRGLDTCHDFPITIVMSAKCKAE